jgi:hypothetical protein
LPLTAKDASSRVPTLTEKQRAAWATIANRLTDFFLAAGHSDAESRAITIANAAARRVTEATDDATVTLIAEALADSIVPADEATAPHFKLTGDVLRQHLADAHYKDKALLGDATDATMANAHITAHNAHESARDTEVHSDLLPLVEKVATSDGTMPIKLIQPGWGSSGYYSREMLTRDGAKAFPKGTQMFMDHPTDAEETARPERSLKDLAAVTTTDPVFQEHPKFGPGLYADAKVMSNWKPVIEELAPHIGVSIRALGRASAKPVTKEGRTGPEIESLVQGRSIDFVTQAGAGGRIAQLFESARAGATVPTKNEEAAVADPKELEEARRQNAEKDQEIARLRGGELLREAHDFIGLALGKTDLPDFVRARVIGALETNPPAKDGKLDKEALATRINEVVKTERDYIAKVTGKGEIRGAGDPPVTEATDFTKDLKEAFMGMGHDEKTAAAMAAGRTN